MIYVDSSVLLADVLVEQKRPLEAFWREQLISSRLLLYETTNRLHVYGAKSQAFRDLTLRFTAIALVAMSDEVLARALMPFKPSIRTLDSLHLATADHLRTSFPSLQLATYDARMAETAAGMGFVVQPD